MDALAIPVRSDEVRWRVQTDELILERPDTGATYSLNSVGRYIWEHADGNRTVRDIVFGLLEEFAVDQTTAWRDAEFFLSHLAAEHLLFFAAMGGMEPAS